MPTYHGGRHEYGQNFLNDRTIINDVIALIDDTDGPIIEIGPGGGALTEPLIRLGRPVTGVEIDSRQVQRLSKKIPEVTLVTGDFLSYLLPSQPHVVVGNLPFHITTAVLRKLLHSGSWSHAVLIVQWEVARRRAGIGGATLMTAQWWPWFTFTVHRRIPGRAFTPSPGVDAGLLTIVRRTSPLIPTEAGRSYRAFVHAVFTGKGRGIREIVARILRTRSASVELKRWLRDTGLPASVLPKDLAAEQWAELYNLAVDLGWRAQHK